MDHAGRYHAAARAGDHFTSTPDGLTLAVARHGSTSGPEILLVHGLRQSRLSWSRQTGGTLAETCQMIGYDLRGHGDSSKPYDVAAYADPALWAAVAYVSFSSSRDCILDLRGSPL